MKNLALLVLVALGCCLLVESWLLGADDAEKSLVGHWKLARDARDSSPHALHGTNRGAELNANGPTDKPGTAAKFDGRDDVVEVAGAAPLDFAHDEFTISVWIHTAAELDDALGDIVAKYDPKQRKGFHFGLLHNVGVPTSQANYRQLTFGIDDGKIDSKWTDHGRPGNAMFIFALTDFNGELYAGTCEAGENESGHVFRFDDQNKTWIDCGSPAPCNSVSALAVYDGKLYAGVSKYRLRGSALGESENPNLGGKVFRYEGEQKWTDCGQLPNTEAIAGLVAYRGKLYASSLYAPAGFFRYEGGTNWTTCSTPGKRVDALTVYNGSIFASGYDEGSVYRYDGEAWTHCGIVGENTQTYSFVVLGGQLHVGTWPSGKMYRYESDKNWIDSGRLGSELEVMGVSAYNGKMYAGTLPLAEVYRYDDGLSWTSIGRVDLTPDVKYRRAWSMAVHDGRLYCGTLPSGHVQSISAGCSATSRIELKPGWRHVAAVKGKDRLHLYIDGAEAAESTTFQAEEFDLSNNQPLRIGAGPHDFLNGRLSDLRIYRRALSEDEIQRLSKQP